MSELPDEIFVQDIIAIGRVNGTYRLSVVSNSGTTVIELNRLQAEIVLAALSNLLLEEAGFP